MMIIVVSTMVQHQRCGCDRQIKANVAVFALLDKASGCEIRQKVQPADSDPMLTTIKRKRFIGDAFDMRSSGKLPSTTTSTLKGKFPGAKLQF